MSSESVALTPRDKLITITRKLLKVVSYTSLTLVVLYFGLLFIKASICYVPPERLKMSEIMVMSSALKTEISEIILASETLYVDTSKLVNTRAFMCQGQPGCLIKSFEIRNTGEFKIDAAPIKSVVAFVPTLAWNENKELEGVKWECLGHPAKFMPAICRIDKSLTLKEKSCQFCH